MASGMPCPRIAFEPQRAMPPAIRPPTTGTPITQAPRRGTAPAGELNAVDQTP
ncbi:hypothetical protein CDEN61S_00108 [Castellaniella denitrificans]